MDSVGMPPGQPDVMGCLLQLVFLVIIIVGITLLLIGVGVGLLLAGVL